MDHLRLHAFRNLQPVEMEPASGINVWLGSNGAGKTSLLEAIYFLSRAKSFRTQQLDRLVQDGADRAWVVGRHCGHQMAVERSSGSTRLRLDGADLRGRARLAERLPVQLITIEHQRLLLDGPPIRRAFIDWGAFHVEHDHHATALRYQQALQQRNASIRQVDRRTVAVWTETLSAAAARLETQRVRFFEQLRPRWDRLMNLWYPDRDLEVTYQRGAGSEAPWPEILHEAAQGDWNAGFTRYGPHRADLVVTAGGRPAREVLSRGQQKMVVIALLLAEIEVWMERDPPPVLLVDDLPAELDAEHLAQVWGVMAGYGIQTHLTAIDPTLLPQTLGSHSAVHEIVGGKVRTMV